MKKKLFSVLFALVLLVSLGLVTAAPAAAIPLEGTIVTLTVPDNVYRPAEFVASSTTTNSGTTYDHVRFSIIVDGPEAFTGDRVDTFTITDVQPGGLQGVNDTFVLTDGDWVGYWGPATGFQLIDGYSAASTFTVEMNNIATAPVGNYDVTVELVDLTPETDVILATATDSFSLSDDTLYVGITEYQYQFTTIQEAIDAADPGDTIIVAAGTYNGDVTIDESVTLQGEDRETTIINGSVTPAANDATLTGFTVNGQVNVSMWDWNSGVVISHNTLKRIYAGACHGLVIENNTISGDASEGIYLDACDNTIITGNTITGFQNGPHEMYAHGYSGAAVFIYSRCDGTEVTNNDLLDNSVGVYLATVSAMDTPANVEVHFNNIEGNDDYGVCNVRFPSGPGDWQYWDYDSFSSANNDVDATDNWWGSANGPEHAGNTFNVGSQGDTVSDNVNYVPWYDTDMTGTSFAPVNNTTDSTKFSSIQAAIDAGTTGTSDIITCEAGTYNEQVIIDKELTLRGATADVNKNGYTVPAGYAWDPNVESIINNPTPAPGEDYTVVDINSVNNVTFKGFVVQALNIPEAGNVQNLLRVNADTPGTCNNIIVQNNVIGPNTDVAGQDGTRGRMGLYLATPTYPTTDGEGITNSTFSGNKIFGCLGNGNNVFVWGAAESYGSVARADYTGTVIEDNEICNSHRSGIEIAGGVNNLVIRNNNIYGNTGLPSDDSTKLKYGTGIVIIRMGSDKTSSNALGSNNLQITGNNISNNEKNGIYLGPINTNHTITGNTFSGNGWDAIRVDLNEEYHGGTCPVTNVASNIVVNFNNISSNTGYGAHVIGTPTNSFVLDAPYNWWGDISGPKQATTNPRGEGDEVSANVDYQPWLTREFQTVLDDNIQYFGHAWVNLDTGWNILSTPIALDPDADTWSEYVALGDPDLHIHGTNPAYSFNAQTGAFVALTSDYQLKPCDAIYVRMLEADIAPILYSPNTSVPSKDVYSGWNLVGLASLDETPANEALASIWIVPGIPGAMGLTQVVSPPMNQPAWIYIHPLIGGDGGAPPMVPTKGYWVFVENPGILAGFTFTPQSLPD